MSMQNQGILVKIRGSAFKWDRLTRACMYMVFSWFSCVLRTLVIVDLIGNVYCLKCGDDFYPDLILFNGVRQELNF